MTIEGSADRHRRRRSTRRRGRAPAPAGGQGAGRRLRRAARWHRPRHLLCRSGLHPDRHHRPGRRGCRRQDAGHLHRRIHPDVVRGLCLSRIQQGRPGLRHVVHLDDARLRPLRRLARRLGGHPGHHHRAGQPGRHRRAVLLPTPRQRVQQPRSRGAVGEPGRSTSAPAWLFLAEATAIAYRGITTTEKVQFVLVFFQLGVLVLFSIMALRQGGGPDDPGDWRSPGTGSTRSPG